MWLLSLHYTAFSLQTGSIYSRRFTFNGPQPGRDLMMLICIVTGETQNAPLVGQHTHTPAQTTCQYSLRDAYMWLMSEKEKIVCP